MPADAIMLFFDIIIVLYGVYGICSAVRMKRTHVPPAILMAAGEMRRLRDAGGFCRKIYRPTVMFGAAACLYGIAALLSRYAAKSRPAGGLAALCFVIICAWYVRKLRKIKEDFIL